MVGGSVARRYAHALFEVARDHGRIEEQDAELRRVLATFAENPSLKTAYESRRTSPDRRKAVVGQVFGDLSAHTLNFLYLLVDKQREGALAAIAAEYRALADAAQGIVEVEVRSAVELGDPELGLLEQRLKAGGARAVRFSPRVDPGLIGGLVLRVGDRLFDGSVRTRMQRLRERLARG